MTVAYDPTPLAAATQIERARVERSRAAFEKSREALAAAESEVSACRRSLAWVVEAQRTAEGVLSHPPTDPWRTLGATDRVTALTRRRIHETERLVGAEIRFAQVSEAVEALRRQVAVALGRLRSLERSHSASAARALDESASREDLDE